MTLGKELSSREKLPGNERIQNVHVFVSISGGAGGPSKREKPMPS